MTVRVISTPLGGRPLTQAAISGLAGRDWFVPRPAGAAQWNRRADDMRSALVDSSWLSALAPAIEASGPAADRLERAAASGFAVTTGQQPGLFGGPLYTWWKALSALALANDLERLTGRPVAPIFWAATDDSDFAEAANTVVAMHDKSVTIEISSLGGEGGALAGMPLGDVRTQLEQLARAAGSAPHAGILDRVRAAYTPDHTIGSAYVQLLRNVLTPLGIAVIDASHEAVRAAASPVLRAALRAADGVESALESRASDLAAAGHALQVKLVKGRSLVFSAKNGKRERVPVRDASAIAETAGSVALGANVLLRPIVERSIIPTVAYVGGPAEIAYFAQVSAVADALGAFAPLIVPRWSGMVVEPRIDRILERHGLSIEGLRDPHAAEMRIARESLPDDLKNHLTNVRQTIEQATDRLAEVDGADIVSPAVIQGLRRNILHRLDRLERRYAAGVKRRGNEALTEVASARAALFPRDVPQERALNVIPLLARHGDSLFENVMAEIELHTAALT